MKTKIWKTVKVSALTGNDILSELSKKGCYVSSYAKELIDKMALCETTEKIDLVKMSLQELGFTSFPTWNQIIEKVKEVGEICPPEVGPLLRIADLQQPKNTWYWIVMKPINDSGGSPDVFCVGRGADGGPWLGAGWTTPDGEWGLVSGVVFRLRKSSKLNTSTLKPSLSTESLTLELKNLKNRVERLEGILRSV